MMKKIIYGLVLLISLCGCGSSPISDDDQQTKDLLNKIEEVFPNDIIDEFDKNLDSTKVELGDDEYCISLGNKETDPTLRFDFTYKDNEFIQFVSKEYGFVDNEVNDVIIDEAKGKALAENFSKVFLDKDVELTVSNDLSGYEDEKYITYQDQDNCSYLVQLNKNMVISYQK